MKKLSDTDTVPNYKHAVTGIVDKGDKADCRRCGATAKVGDAIHGWHRHTKEAVHLPFAIELCDRCDHQLRLLQSNLPK